MEDAAQEEAICGLVKVCLSSKAHWYGSHKGNSIERLKERCGVRSNAHRDWEGEVGL